VSESAGTNRRAEPCGVFPPATSSPGETFCSSSYPHAGQTNPSQQKYGTINPHAGHCIVAIGPPPDPLALGPSLQMPSRRCPGRFRGGCTRATRESTLKGHECRRALPTGRVAIPNRSPRHSHSRTHPGGNVHTVNTRNRRSDLNAGLLKA
jgi:hypothetical protein